MRQVSVKEYSEHPEETLASVEAGETVDIIRDGKSVARLVPVVSLLSGSTPERDPKAIEEFREMLRTGVTDRVEPWTRAELYEERLKRFFP